MLEAVKGIKIGKNKETAGDLIDQGRCPICAKPIKLTDFRDPISANEYKISGLCQACQDITFN